MQSPLHKESAVLSRLIYKFDKKFRSDIGFRKLKKVNTALRRYLTLNLLKDVETFSSLFPSTTEELYMPTCQMLQYILVRIISFGKIMCRIYITAKQAGIFYLDRIKHGESHWMSLMPYAVLCRIWSLVSILLQHACKWYEELYKYTETLEMKGIPFLNNDYKLPSNLSDYLEVDKLDEQGIFEWLKNKIVEVVPILNEADDGDDCFNLYKYVHNINETVEENVIKDDIKVPQMEQILQAKTLKESDKGEVISRQTFNSTVQNIESNKKMGNINIRNKISNEIKLIHSIEIISNNENLKEFISKEEELRNQNNNNSLTGHLSFMQFQVLKNNLISLFELKLENKKMLKRFHRLWKDKCLDYL